MSSQSLEAIVGRTLLDEGFRIELFADPNLTLAGYQLTTEERASLLALDAETLDAIAEILAMRMARPGCREQVRSL